MRGIPFNFQGQGVLEKWKEEEVLSFVSNEPTSVLDTRRSPSPPTSTSTSTLASSFAGGGGSTSSVGGGGGSADNITGVAAGPLVSDNCLQKWPVSLPLETNPADPVGVCGGGSRKDEWAAELQPITSGLVELVAGGAGEERCGGLGLGLEDWESMLSESAAASPGHEQSLLRWISGDADDPSFGLKHLLQSGGNPLEFDGNAEMGMLDHGGAVFEASGAPATGNLIATSNPSSLGIGGSGYSANNNNNGKIGSIAQNLSTGVVNYRAFTVGLNNNYNPQNPIFSASPNNLPLPVSLPPGMIYQQQQQQQQLETSEEKPQIFNSQPAINHHQQSPNPNYFPVLPYTQQDQHHLLQPPEAKRHNPGGLDPSSHMPKVPFADLGHEFLLRRQQQQQPLCFTNPLQLLPQHLLQQKQLMVSKQKMVGGGEEMASQSQQQQQQQQQQQALLDQLCKAAELVGTGNFSLAQGILARLNHQLSPEGKPFQRAAFYFKEALQLILMNNNPAASPPLRSPTPFDVIFKMGAYKVFSDVSPLIQFANFTCNQALLEALDDADRIHIIDFDIGFGAQWASFMQELPVRNRGAPSLKITAFASPFTTHHPLELKLLRENLTLFADDIGIAFELQVVNFDSIDPVSYSMPYFRTSENEAIVVNFPIWSSSNHPAALPLLLRFIKQLSPKLMVSLDRGCDRGDLPLQQHLLHGIQSYTNLMESLDATNVMADTVSKIERFLFQPRIESTTLGRLRTPDKMPPWKTLFASAGFTPVSFSNFTESQADCVVKRTFVRGFHVEKRQALLILCWQNRELISASAWRC